jgi:hypothetical protein
MAALEQLCSLKVSPRRAPLYRRRVAARARARAMQAANAATLGRAPLVELYTYVFAAFGARHPLVAATEQLVSTVFGAHLSVAQARALLRFLHQPPPSVGAAEATAEYCRVLLRILHRASPQRAPAPAPAGALQRAFVELWANPAAEQSRGRVHISSVAGEGLWPPPQGYTVGVWLYFERLPDAAQPLTIVALGSGPSKASGRVPSSKTGSGNSSPRQGEQPSSPRGAADASAEWATNSVQARLLAHVYIGLHRRHARVSVSRRCCRSFYSLGASKVTAR